MSTILVLAKEPVPGRVKTRLSPALTAAEAAAVATAALADTFAAVMAVGADRVVVALDGRPGPWLPTAVEVVGQGTGGLAERLTTAWSTTSGPTVQIGMDTPQVKPADLCAGLAALETHGAALGPAADGGWWALALRRPHHRMFTGVPMSRTTTGAAQLERLRALGISASSLRALCDIDHVEDLASVVASHPHLTVGRVGGPLVARFRRSPAAAADR